MKLQVLLGVYVCALPFYLQAEEENRERPVRPLLEKRAEDRKKHAERGRERGKERGEERSEKMRHHHEGRVDMFNMLDKNKDGVISAEEFFASPRMARMDQEQRDKLFARIDLDGDGKVTPEEIRKMRQESHERKMREFRELDTDENGGLSFEELSKGKFFSQLPEEKRRQIFDRMDTNGDGEITPEDRPQGPRPHPEGRERGKRFKDREVSDEAPSVLD